MIRSLAAAALYAAGTQAQDLDPPGPAMEGFPYPHQVQYFPVTMKGQALQMAYMDVPPSGATNGRIPHLEAPDRFHALLKEFLLQQ